MSRSSARLPAATRGALAMLAAVLTAAVLAGCSAAPEPVALPSHAPAAAATPAAAPRPSPSASASVRAQVIQADRGYADAVDKALASRNPAEARSLLSGFLPADSVGVMVSGMVQKWSKGEVYYGENVPHILAVTIRGTVALVHECDDASSAGWEYAASGKIVPGSLVDPLLNLTTRLTMTHGRWVIQYQNILSATCKA